jgi:enoyl-CoA hydratase/carnithine racemase
MPHPATVSAPLLLVERIEKQIAVLTLNRPQARNALSVDLMADLSTAVKRLGADPSVAAIVLMAEGPAFCAGHDLKELTSHRSDDDGGRAFYAATMSQCAAMMRDIVACRVPVIAAIEGTATAAGCQLVATCDLAVAAETATFSTPGVNIGLFCSTPMVALSRNVPRKRAMEMLLLGEMLSAAEALEYGLLNRVTQAARVRETAFDFARTIASKSRATIAVGKDAFYAQIEKPLDEAYTYAADVMVKNMMSADAKEGIGAFLDKRPARWSGC